MNKKCLCVVFIIFIFALYPALAQDEPPPLDNNGLAKGFPGEPAEQIEKQDSSPEPSSGGIVSSAPGQSGIVMGKQNKISLDIKGMDIIDVLKMLSVRAGINMVIGKNVTGRVTLFLKEVDVWDAFEIILLSNDLAYEQKGGIINIMSQRDYELLYGERYQDKKQAKVIQLKYAKAADLSKALNQIKTNVGKVIVDEGSNTLVLVDAPQKVAEMEGFLKKTDLPLETKIFGLNYAQVEKISAKLQEAITKGVGSMKIDERTNKIAITDYPEKLDEIGQVIKAFDEKTPQVLIDAQIIEITPSDQFQLGVDWDFWIKKYFDIKMSLPVNTTNALILGTSNSAPSKKGQYKAVIDILRTIGDTKILSSPRIMALNNQEAKILIGTKEAYLVQTTSQAGSGTQVTADQVNFVDVGTKLYVTPTVNRDNFVTMKIKPEISSSDYKDFGSNTQPKPVPIVTTSESETTVMVKDGVTIIIGGFKRDKRTKNVKKIPLLGDIPVFGFLFSKVDDKLEKKELVILLTPHIMSGEKSYSDFSETTPTDGAVAKMVKGDIVIEKVSKSSADTDSKDSSNEYYNFVVAKVRELAMLDRPKGEKGQAELEFTLTKRGRLVGEAQVTSIDNPVLEPFALRAIKNASPFPPFPGSLHKEKQSFRVVLYYE